MEPKYYSKEEAKAIEKADSSKKAIRCGYGPHKGKYVIMPKAGMVDTRYNVFESDLG